MSLETSSAVHSALFAVRVALLDWYLAAPVSKDHGVVSSSAPVLCPVIRVFGATPAGQKCCIHIHGAFPYFYVHVTEPLTTEKHVSDYCDSLHQALESTLRQGSGQGSAPTNGAGAASSATGDAGAPDRPSLRLVRSVQLVSGVPYYGYQCAPADADPSVAFRPYPQLSAQHVFAKITLYNPALIRKAATLLQSGRVGGVVYQPYESHVPFHLQFLIDYNLCGMALLTARDVRFRMPLPARPPAMPLSTRTLEHRYNLSALNQSVASITHGLSFEGLGSGNTEYPLKLALPHRLWLDSNTPHQLRHEQPATQIRPAASVPVAESALADPSGTSMSAGVASAAASAAARAAASAAAAAAAPAPPPTEHALPPWLNPLLDGIVRPSDAYGCARDGTGSVSKSSVTALEVDVWVQDLLNPLDREAMRAAAAVAARKGSATPSLSDMAASQHATFSSVFSLAYLWEEERQRRQALGLPPPSGSDEGLGTTQGTQPMIGQLQQQSQHASRDNAQDVNDLFLHLDATMEKQLAGIVASDRKRIGSSTRRPQAGLRIPPASAAGYGADSVVYKPAWRRAGRARPTVPPYPGVGSSTAASPPAEMGAASTSGTDTRPIQQVTATPNAGATASESLPMPASVDDAEVAAILRNASQLSWMEEVLAQGRSVASAAAQQQRGARDITTAVEHHDMSDSSGAASRRSSVASDASGGEPPVAAAAASAAVASSRKRSRETFETNADTGRSADIALPSPLSLVRVARAASLASQASAALPASATKRSLPLQRGTIARPSMSPALGTVADAQRSAREWDDIVVSQLEMADDDAQPAASSAAAAPVRDASSNEHSELHQWLELSQPSASQIRRVAWSASKRHRVSRVVFAQPVVSRADVCDDSEGRDQERETGGVPQRQVAADQLVRLTLQMQPTGSVSEFVASDRQRLLNSTLQAAGKRQPTPPPPSVTARALAEDASDHDADGIAPRAQHAMFVSLTPVSQSASQRLAAMDQTSITPRLSEHRGRRHHSPSQAARSSGGVLALLDRLSQLSAELPESERWNITRSPLTRMPRQSAASQSGAGEAAAILPDSPDEIEDEDNDAHAGTLPPPPPRSAGVARRLVLAAPDVDADALEAGGAAADVDDGALATQATVPLPPEEGGVEAAEVNAIISLSSQEGIHPSDRQEHEMPAAQALGNSQVLSPRTSETATAAPSDNLLDQSQIIEQQLEELLSPVPHLQSPVSAASVQVVAAPHYTYKLSFKPPTTAHLMATLGEYGLLEVPHPDAHYSSDYDAPHQSKVLGGLEFRVPSSAIHNLQLFDTWPSVRVFYKRCALEAALIRAAHMDRSGSATALHLSQALQHAVEHVEGWRSDADGGGKLPATFRISVADGSKPRTAAQELGGSQDSYDDVSQDSDQEAEPWMTRDRHVSSLRMPKAAASAGAVSGATAHSGDAGSAAVNSITAPNNDKLLQDVLQGVEGVEPPFARLATFADIAAAARAWMPRYQPHRSHAPIVIDGGSQVVLSDTSPSQSQHAFVKQVLLPETAPLGLLSGGHGADLPSVLLRRYVAQQQPASTLPLEQQDACMLAGHVAEEHLLPGSTLRPRCTRTVLRWSQPVLSAREARKWVLRHPPPALVDESSGLATKAAIASAAVAPRFDANTGVLLPPAPEAFLQLSAPTATPAIGALDRSAVSTTPGTSTPASVAQAGAVGLLSQVSPAHVRGAAAAAAASAAVAPAAGFKRAPVRRGGRRGSVSKAAKLTPSAEAPPVPTPSRSVNESTVTAVGAADANQHLTIVSMELHVRTRGTLLPDPRVDPILAFVYAIHHDDVVEHVRSKTPVGFKYERALITGVVMIDDGATATASLPMGAPQWDEAGAARLFNNLGLPPSVLMSRVPDERALLWAYAYLVRSWDADILVGYETQRASIGYLLDRATYLHVPLPAHLSRTPTAPHDRRTGGANASAGEGQDAGAKETEAVSDEKYDSGPWLPGRLVLNVWRIMRGELKLGIYSLENVVWNTLKQRLPHFSFATLTRWYDEPSLAGSAGSGAAASAAPKALHTRWQVLRHLLDRACLTLHLIDHMNLIGRTSEMARLFGIDFFSVLSRGSQFRVEAVMLRVSKPLDYLAPSPSRTQVARQAAMECIPLIMEPQSRIHSSPVVVLDFQSLYPSIIIAYNMCFSTCLGRLAAPPEAAVNGKLGFMEYDPPLGAMAAMYGGLGEATRVRRGDVPVGSRGAPAPPRPHRPQGMFVSPNGAVFAPWAARQGILPRMLQEILETRVMVKNAMKGTEVKSDPGQMRVMHARQFALKMIANVTYGYTAAGFSGRMPCAEIADAIVQTGRNTLERAIRLVESTERWGARVVYGDTDSMFVLLPGKSVEQAHQIGNEIAAEVTARNPRPITLKMDKVYHPCVLVAKKRYAGRMFESPSQTVGVLDCKGLEMVRRDTCGIVSKLMEGSMRIMFDSMDLSSVKAYLVRQWTKLLEGRTSIADLVFAKEVRLGSYSERGPLPPAAIVASKGMMSDPRAEPRYGERVRYVVVAGSPTARLVDLVVTPHQLLAANAAASADGGTKSMQYRINTQYYVTKAIIPALNRIFSLVGADLFDWFRDMKRPAVRRYRPLPPADATAIAEAQVFTEHTWASDELEQQPPDEEDGHQSAEAARSSVVIDVSADLTDVVSPVRSGETPSSRHGTPGGSEGAAVRSTDRPRLGRMQSAVVPSAAAAASSGIGPIGSRGSTLESYYAHATCELCGTSTMTRLCADCLGHEQRSGYVLLQRLRVAETDYAKAIALCRSCTGFADPAAANACDSLDCPVFFQRHRAADALAHIRTITNGLGLATASAPGL